MALAKAIPTCAPPTLMPSIDALAEDTATAETSIVPVTLMTTLCPTVALTVGLAIEVAWPPVPVMMPPPAGVPVVEVVAVPPAVIVTDELPVPRI